MEYHLILHHLESSVITFNDKQIKYFNKAGETLLNDSISVLQEEEPVVKA